MRKSIIGLILIVLAISGMLYWELVGRDSLLYTQVLTVNRDIEAGTIITQDMLGLKKTATPTLNSCRLKDAQNICGKETLSFLPAGAELFMKYFEEEKLLLHEELGEYIFSLPTSWMLSCPQTLRRGDWISFLIICPEDEDGKIKTVEGFNTGDEIFATTVLYVKSSSNDEVTSDQGRLKSADTVSVIEIVAKKEQAQLLTKLASQNCKFVLLYQ